MTTVTISAMGSTDELVAANEIVCRLREVPGIDARIKTIPQDHVAGHKGTDAGFVITAALSTPAVGAMVGIFRAWLGRNEKRSLRIESSGHSIHLDGHSYRSEREMVRALAEVLARSESAGESSG